MNRRSAERRRAVRVLCILNMLRPLNGIMASTAVLIGWSIASDSATIIPLTLPSLMLCTYFAVSAVNIANDMDDVVLDNRAHPDRALPSGALSRRSAMVLLTVNWVLGLLSFCAVVLLGGSDITFFLTIMGFLLLVSYERMTKDLGVLGNINVAVLTMFPFLLGASLEGPSARVFLLCPMAFTINLARELLKDIDDMEGDKGRRRSMPLVHGEIKTLFAAAMAICAAVLSSLLPLLFWRTSPFYLIPIIAADLFFFLALLPFSRKGSGALLLKIGIWFGLIGFIFL